MRVEDSVGAGTRAGAYGIVWEVCADSFQPGGDVEAHRWERGRGACLQLVCSGGGAPVRPRLALSGRHLSPSP